MSELPVYYCESCVCAIRAVCDDESVTCPKCGREAWLFTLEDAQLRLAQLRDNRLRHDRDRGRDGRGRQVRCPSCGGAGQFERKYRTDPMRGERSLLATSCPSRVGTGGTTVVVKECRCMAGK